MHRQSNSQPDNDFRINEQIRAPYVLLIGAAGQQLGQFAVREALRRAREEDLDLVEVAPTAKPPVCRLMDYGRFKYEAAHKARASKRDRPAAVVKEQKLRPRIEAHDYRTKLGHVARFLGQGHRVKVTVMFRGREQSRPELGYRLLGRLAEDVAELARVEQHPVQTGRDMTMMLAPHKGGPARRGAGGTEPQGPPDAEAAPITR